MEKEEALLEIIKLQKEIIELQKRFSEDRIIVPSSLEDVCDHDWMYAWFSTTPPPCKKCGKLLYYSTFNIG